MEVIRKVTGYADPQLQERHEVGQLAENYQGLQWIVTSLYVYRYKDTGECLYTAMLSRRNWDGCGDRRVRVLIARENGQFRVRPAEMVRLHG